MEKSYKVLERKVLEWVGAVLEQKLPVKDFQSLFGDGVLLCRLLNKIKSGSVRRINEGVNLKHKLKQVDNINSYVDGFKKLSLGIYVFDTISLSEGRDLYSVIVHLYSFGQRVKRAPGYCGPFISRGGSIAIAKQHQVRKSDKRKSEKRRSEKRPKRGLRRQTQETPQSIAPAINVKPATIPKEPTPKPKRRFKRVRPMSWFAGPAKGVQISVPSLEKSVQAKEALKHDSGLEQATRKWIESVLDTKFEGSFASFLKSGVILCNLANAVIPGSIDGVQTARNPFVHRENIAKYLAFCKKIGMSQSFDTNDLYEEQNLMRVIINIYSIADKAAKLGYKGPTIQPENEASTNKHLYGLPQDHKDDHDSTPDTEEEKKLVVWVNKHITQENKVQSFGQCKRGSILVQLCENLSGTELITYGGSKDISDSGVFLNSEAETGILNVMEVYRSVTQITMKPPPVQAKDVVLGNRDALAQLLQFMMQHLDRDNYLKSLKQDTRCLKITEEIIESEESYLNYLTILCQNFVKPFQSDPSLQSIQPYIKKLPDLLDICEEHKALIERIKKNRKEDQREDYKALAHVFQNHTQFLLNYSAYLNNYEANYYSIKVLRRENQGLDKLIEGFESSYGAGLDLLSFLIMPVQRVGRYVLLFRELRTNVPKQDEDVIAKAESHLQTCADTLNEKQREFEKTFSDMHKLIELQKQLKDFDDLIHPKRKFVREGAVTLIQRDEEEYTDEDYSDEEDSDDQGGDDEDSESEEEEECEAIDGMAFLLCDYLLFASHNQAKDKTKFPLIFETYYPLAFVEETCIADDDDCAVDITFEEGSITLKCTDSADADAWLADIENAVKHVAEVDILLFQSEC